MGGGKWGHETVSAEAHISLDISPSGVLDGIAHSLEANWGGTENGLWVVWASNRAGTQLMHSDGVS